MKLQNTLQQAHNTSRLLLTAANPRAPMGRLHRSLGLQALKIEGYLSRKQADWFRDLLEKNPSVTRIIEIGFNGGHSSCVFLSARDDITVVSFDLGFHGYVTRAKQYIDQTFPGRHTLVLGDSRETVPAYRADHPAEMFNLAFVDGGHEYEVASADLRNILPMTHPAGLIVMDDLKTWKNYGRGPNQAWHEAKEEGIVSELELLQDGNAVSAVRHRTTTSVWAVGRPADRVPQS